MIRKIQKFVRLSSKEKRLFFHAYLIIGYTSLIITIIPIRRFFKKFGEQGKESASLIANDDLLKVHLVEKAVRRAAKFLPWRAKCFSRAITAKVLLKRMRIPSTLYLGVAKEGSTKMIAHAWVRSGTVIITGKEEMSKFTPLVFFT